MATGCLPADAAQFLCYEVMKDKLNMHNEEYSVSKNVAIGAATVLAHDLFIAPSDLLKQRLQLCNQVTTRELVSSIFNSDGARGFLKSYPITLFMNLPFQCTVVCVNENLKTYV